MNFSLSPSVRWREFDLTTTVKNVATAIAGVVIQSSWGPCFERKLTTSERDMIDYWGYPNVTKYAVDWWVADSFLRYSDTLYVVRAVDGTTAKNSVLAGYEDTVQTITYSGLTGTFAVDDVVTGGTSTATGIVISDNGTDSMVIRTTSDPAVFQTAETLTGAPSGATATSATITEMTTNEPSAALYIPNYDGIPTVTFGTGDRIIMAAKYPGTLGNTKIKVSIANDTDFPTANIKTGVTFLSEFDEAPEAGEIAIAVQVINEQDEQWYITEKWVLSLSPTARDNNGFSKYAEYVLNLQSKWIYMFVNTTLTKDCASFEENAFTLGVDGDPASGDIQTGYDLFSNPEEFDVNMVLDGANNDETIQGYINDNVCLNRLDCMGIFTVPWADVSGADLATNIAACVTHRDTDLNKNSSYSALYANWKKIYDKFNDVYRWIPVSGDVGGIFARNDYISDVWMAPAGLNRGMLKNVEALAIYPQKAHRDTLYKNQINMIVSFPGEGTVVWGQKTLLTKPSAFDRINVRRLFIVLEKSIATMARWFINETNDEYTQNLFVMAVEPFLQRYKDEGGIEDFYVVCDNTNNTSEVKANNEFIGDIYIKPPYSIEFITLNFIATKHGVDFNEIIRK